MSEFQIIDIKIKLVFKNC